MATEENKLQEHDTNNIWKPEDPHEIELSVTVQYIGSVDVVKESFDARLWIDVFWLPSETELKSNSSPTEWDFERNLQTTNAVALHSFDIKKPPQIKTLKDGRKMYHAVVQLSATFSSPFDLHSFPFDSQKLFIVIEMGNIKNMIYKPADHISCPLSIETQLCVLNEWDFEDANISFTASDESLSKQGNRYAQCIVQLILPRKWQSFVERYLVIIALLVISTMATYAIGYEDVGDRLGFIFTLLLTLVAFQFIIAENLPPTSYLTFFDQYYVWCMVVIFLNVLAVSFAPTIVDEAGFDDFDKLCMYLSLASIIIVHVYFFIRSFTARRKGLERVMSVDLDEDEMMKSRPKNIKVSKDTRARFPGETDERFITFGTVNDDD